MQNHVFANESSSEEIYLEMTRDAFGVLQKNKSIESDIVYGPELSREKNSISEPKYDQFLQKLVNTFSAQFQVILPGAFKITPQPKQCLSYANLHSWSPGRAYFSLFEIKKTKYVWILHLSRSIGEGLAYLVHKGNSQTDINIYQDLREADSLIYLEIGELLRRLFVSLIEIWPKNYNLQVLRCRHILQLGFQNSTHLSEKYIILPFNLDNKECSGDFHLIFPQKFILNLFNN